MSRNILLVGINTYSYKHLNKWKNRLKFIGFGLIIPIGLTVYLGFAVKKQAKIRELWYSFETYYHKNAQDNAKIEDILAARTKFIQILQELVKVNINLNNFNFSSINLGGSNLSSANLNSANFNGAILSSANLTDTNLSGTNLRISTLNGAILSNTDLSHTNLINTDITAGLLLASTDINIPKIKTDNYNISNKKVVLKKLAQALKLKQLNHGHLSNEACYQVTIDYYNMQQANEQVKLDKLSLKTAELFLRDQQLLEEAGLGTYNEILSFKIDLEIAQQEVNNALLQQQIYRGRLANSLGLSTSTKVIVNDPVKIDGLWHLTLKQSITKALNNIDKKQQQHRNQIKFKIEELFAKVNYYLENIDVRNKISNMTEEKVRLARLRFQAGFGDYSDVIKSEKILQEQENNRIRAILDYNRSLAELKQAVMKGNCHE
ncbi:MULTISPECIES: pentapeptide repeat-containing protein [unclassified Moorena]|uniref:pentapeptide repeat-containing protein n=1 Tax=unclassified Moorena TaxID=2683338 RepID=UPI0013CC16F0|nr:MULTISPECIES: pentapeptide repeat-containing protein [unclassified Moorena]NEO23254.1 TolC family protein [Moorena sp. SIO4A5]NEQ61154.1 TolC family protein [Moorena sp. SIO4A1]